MVPSRIGGPSPGGTLLMEASTTWRSFFSSSVLRFPVSDIFEEAGT